MLLFINKLLIKINSLVILKIKNINVNSLFNKSIYTKGHSFFEIIIGRIRTSGLGTLFFRNIKEKKFSMGYSISGAWHAPLIPTFVLANWAV